MSTSRPATPGVPAGTRQHGLMLLEFAISMGFMAVLGVLVVNMLGQGWELNSRNRAILVVAVASSTSTTWLIRDIHVADATDIPDGGGAQSTAQFTWNDAGGARFCDYSLVAGNIRRSCDTGTIRVAANASNLAFQRSGDLVTISYDLISPERAEISDNIVLNVALGAG